MSSVLCFVFFVFNMFCFLLTLMLSSFVTRSQDPNRRMESQRMSDLYGGVCEMWNRLHIETEGNLRVECRDQKFSQISRDTYVALFLTYPDNESNDVLLKARNTLRMCQCCLLCFTSADLCRCLTI